MLRPQECARKCAVGSLTCDYCDAVKKFAAQKGTLGVAGYPGTHEYPRVPFSAPEYPLSTPEYL